jgi:hypothetical protein
MLGDREKYFASGFDEYLPKRQASSGSSPAGNCSNSRVVAKESSILARRNSVSGTSVPSTEFGDTGVWHRILPNLGCAFSRRAGAGLAAFAFVGQWPCFADTQNVAFHFLAIESVHGFLCAEYFG